MSRPTRRPVRLLVFAVALAGAGLLAGCGDGVQEANIDVTVTVPDVTLPTTAPDATTTTTAAEEATTTTEADTTDTTAANGDAPDPQAPGDLGDDAQLDSLADDCFDGDFSACDQLFFDSPVDSDYEAYGDSCGGRNEPAGLCVNIYGQG
jgi:hypothetical protein